MLRRLRTSIGRRWLGLRAQDGFLLRRSAGQLLLLDVTNYVDRQIALDGDFEAAQQAWLLAAMRRAGCDIFCDVGANLGLYSLRVAAAGLAPRILAFEPDARNRAQLHANLLLNRLAERVEVRAEAISDRAGSIGFAPASDRFTGQSRVAEDGSARVSATTLDALLPGAGLRVAIKMDIEGHEGAACRGLAEAAAAHRILLQVECFPDALPALTALLGGMGLTPRHRIDHDHYFANHLLD